jgi:hypothetical protein
MNDMADRIRERHGHRMVGMPGQQASITLDQALDTALGALDVERLERALFGVRFNPLKDSSMEWAERIAAEYERLSRGDSTPEPESRSDSASRQVMPPTVSGVGEAVTGLSAGETDPLNEAHRRLARSDSTPEPDE